MAASLCRMQIERIPEWALTPEDEVQIAGLLARAFSTDFGGRSYFQQRHHLRLVVRQTGRIIGHMALLFRAVRLGVDLTDIAGLADVATDPNQRGRGIAQALLHEAIAEARASQAAYFVLFGNANLYSGNGFARQINPLTYLDMPDAKTGSVKTEPAQELMVLSLRGQAWDTSARLDLLGTLF